MRYIIPVQGNKHPLTRLILAGELRSPVTQVETVYLYPAVDSFKEQPPANRCIADSNPIEGNLEKIPMAEDRTKGQIKSIQIEVVQSDSFGRNPGEPRIYYGANLGEHIECRERCQDGGFRIGGVVNEMEKRHEVHREVTAFCLGRDKRTQQRCKNRFSVEIRIEYWDA